MSISFNEVPSTIRTPIVAVEFDSSKARQGPKIQEYRGLCVGMKTTGAGTVAELVVKQATSAEQVGGYFGFDSQIYWMARRWFGVNQIVALDVVAIDEPSGGTAAEGTFTITGTPTAAGTLYAYVAGVRYQVGITTASTPTTIAAALVVAINLDPHAPVTAAAALGVVTCTAVFKGVDGDDIDLRFNYQAGEDLPAGVTVVVALMGVTTAGSGSPDLTEVWPLITNTHYNVLAIAFNDQTSLSAADTELTDRWGLRMQEGVAFFGARGDHSALTTLGNANNSRFVSIMGAELSPSTPWEFAGAMGGIASRYMQADPGRPLQTLPLTGVLPPADVDLFTRAERDLLLHDGIATYVVDAGGVVRVERSILSYQTNPVTTSPDDTFLDVQTPLTLGYLRFDFRTRFGERFPRHKLGENSTRYGAGQAIMTPAIGRAFAVAVFQDWEELALVEGLEQFKADLVVERNGSDRNRLDFLLPPDLINQLRVTAVQIGFLL